MRSHRLAPLGTTTLILTAWLLAATGCVRVVRQESPYYVKGPHQAEPPDGYFPAGTRLLIFGEKDSYSRTMSFDGVFAHVWNQDLISLSEWDKQQRQARANEEP